MGGTLEGAEGAVE